MNLKKAGRASLILGIIFIIAGIVIMNIKVPSGYVNTSGIYKKSYSTNSDLELFGCLVCTAGSIAALLGIGTLFMNHKIKKSPIITKTGTVIEKDSNSAVPTVIIQFDDGSRSKFTVINNLILSVGDKGSFSIQKNYVISYDRI